MEILIAITIVLACLITLIINQYIERKKFKKSKEESSGEAKKIQTLKREILSSIIDDVNRQNNVQAASDFIPHKRMSKVEAFHYINEVYGEKMAKNGFRVTPDIDFEKIPVEK